MRPSRGALFFLILVLTTSVILFVSAQYGEESTSLGQFVDEFTDLNNVSVRVNTLRNTTLNCMELNWTVGLVDIDIFNDDFEADNLNKWDDTGGWSTGAPYNWSSSFGAKGVGVESQLNVDLGADYNDPDMAFSIWIQPRIYRTYLKLCDFSGGGIDVAVDIFHFDGSDTWYYFWGGSVAIAAGCPENKWYNLYIDDFDFAAETYDVSIYDDGMNLKGSVDDADMGLTDSDDVDYIRIMTGLGATSGEGYIDDVNFSIPGGGGLLGYFLTENYLNYTQGSSLTLLTNTTIPEQTSMTVEFSDDNSTWINQTALTDGFQSIELRTLNWSSAIYLNYSLSTTNGSRTPQIYQSRLITTEGVPERVNVSSEWTYFNVTELNVTIGTVDAGNITSLYFMDRNRLNVSETVGVPAMEVEFNFTGISTNARCVWLVMNTFYDGSASHDFCVQVWNLTSSAWVTIDVIPDQTGFEWTNATIYDLRIPNDYLDGSGKIIARLCHTSAGNINHDLSVNLIQIYVELPSDVPPVAGDVDIGPWIAIAIILSIIAYLLARSR